MALDDDKLKTVRHGATWVAILYVVIKVLQVIYDFLAG